MAAHHSRWLITGHIDTDISTEKPLFQKLPSQNRFPYTCVTIDQYLRTVLHSLRNDLIQTINTEKTPCFHVLKPPCRGNTWIPFSVISIRWFPVI
jgi:hypothetical protein